MGRVDLASVCSDVLERPIVAVQRIGGGRNSSVFRLDCGNAGSYVAKVYFRDDLNERRRLEVEFRSLEFLWRCQVRDVPEPIAALEDIGVAIYEDVSGERIEPGEATPRDIDHAVAFLGALRDLREETGSRDLAPASEACFSVQAIVNNIKRRLDRLRSLPGDRQGCRGLHEFLGRDFVPSFNEIIERCRTRFSQSEKQFESEIPQSEQTLSPSDFGFHNALRRNGKIVFLDFEYFGWDDPAKMICDFLLHPAMELGDDLKRYFRKRIFAQFDVEERVAVVYALFGLQWCLILLNEFAPEHLRRRAFAGADQRDVGNLQAEQLNKARRMLGKVVEGHEYAS